MTAAIFAASTAGASVPTGFATVNSPVAGVIPGSGTCTTSPAKVVILDGRDIASYAWSKVAGDENWTINTDEAPSLAKSASFTYAGLLNGDFQTAEFQCVASATGAEPAPTTVLLIRATVRSTSTL